MEILRCRESDNSYEHTLLCFEYTYVKNKASEISDDGIRHLANDTSCIGGAFYSISFCQCDVLYHPKKWSHTFR